MFLITGKWQLISSLTNVLKTIQRSKYHSILPPLTVPTFLRIQYLTGKGIGYPITIAIYMQNKTKHEIGIDLKHNFRTISIYVEKRRRLLPYTFFKQVDTLPAHHRLLRSEIQKHYQCACHLQPVLR